MQRVIGIILGVLASMQVFAADLPANCQTSLIAVQNGQFVLHTSLDNKPQVVLLHNLTKDDLMITHEVVQPSASAGWSSYLRPQHWSAFMVVQPKFSLVCSKMQGQAFISVDCSKTIEACAYTDFCDQEHSATGTYWVAEDAPLDKLLEKIASRKIKLGSCR